MSKTSHRFVIQYAWSWKHKDESHVVRGQRPWQERRRPPDLGIDHLVDLTNEVLVRLLQLLPSSNVLQRT
jgi:hypothetical protein